MMIDTGGAHWATHRIWSDGEWVIEEVPTQTDPITGIEMCKDCWNADHHRCVMPQCKCEHYKGRNKGLNRPRKPAMDCEENQSFPDPGGISF